MASFLVDRFEADFVEGFQEFAPRKCWQFSRQLFPPALSCALAGLVLLGRLLGSLLWLRGCWLGLVRGFLLGLCSLEAQPPGLSSRLRLLLGGLR